MFISQQRLDSYAFVFQRSEFMTTVKFSDRISMRTSQSIYGNGKQRSELLPLAITF